MKLVGDDLEETYYIDVILATNELDRLRMGEMIDAYMRIGGKAVFIGTRMDRSYNEKELEWED